MADPSPSAGRSAASPLDRRTTRRRSGDAAEARAAERLVQGGWRIVAKQLRVGRDEIDILAIDPGPPPTLVVVEVRSRTVSRFGRPEERVDPAKVRRLYRAAASLRAAGRLPDGTLLPSMAWRVDLLAVDPRPAPIRHLRGLIPG